jgi:hypothetical protein
MTCRIERSVGKDGITVFLVSGHVEAKYMSKIEEMIAREGGHIALDLNELTLVDRDAVTYLASCKRKGIELRNCPPFLIEWISKEQ